MMNAAVVTMQGTLTHPTTSASNATPAGLPVICQRSVFPTTRGRRATTCTHERTVCHSGREQYRGFRAQASPSTPGIRDAAERPGSTSRAAWQPAVLANHRHPLLDKMTSGDELYFAYGSNMSPKVLTGRRGVSPKASMPGVLQGHTSELQAAGRPGTYPLGLPYIEPGFGTIERSEPKDRQDVHGVVHLVRRDDWASIKRTEGVNGSTQYGYQEVRLSCKLYDGREVTVVTLQAASGSLLEGSRPRGRYGVTGAVQPSARYLTIIREGAEHHGLSPEYRQWLQGLPSFDNDTLASRLGAVATASTAAGLGLGAFATASAVAAVALPWLPAAFAATAVNAAMQSSNSSNSGGGNTGRTSNSQGTTYSSVGVGSSSGNATRGTQADAVSSDSGSSRPGSSTNGLGSREFVPRSQPSSTSVKQQQPVVGVAQDVAEEAAEQQPNVADSLVSLASTAVWTVHDLVLSPVFGSGR